MRTLIILSFLITSCMSPTDHSTNNASNPDAEEINDKRVLYSFTEQGQGNWQVEDDVVMGGRSSSELKMTGENYAHFSGRVSLENDGGFCSIHQVVENDPYTVSGRTAFALRLNGDGKDYNFRVRTPNGKHFYAFTFPTLDEDKWETIIIPFDAMEATFHGEPVDVPNYAGEQVVEMQILIGNQKEQTFELLIAAVEVM